MKKKLGCILLVDDNPGDNRYHKIILEEMDVVDCIDIVRDGLEALKYLKDRSHNPPELIFLDINMPKMNGWEFLENYQTIDEDRKAKSIVMMLTTSVNPADRMRAQKLNILSGFETKPLTEDKMANILKQHFVENVG